jgi:hypothetical protein
MFFSLQSCHGLENIRGGLMVRGKNKNNFFLQKRGRPTSLKVRRRSQQIEEDQD